MSLELLVCSDFGRLNIVLRRWRCRAFTVEYSADEVHICSLILRSVNSEYTIIICIDGHCCGNAAYIKHVFGKIVISYDPFPHTQIFHLGNEIFFGDFKGKECNPSDYVLVDITLR